MKLDADLSLAQKIILNASIIIIYNTWIIENIRGKYKVNTTRNRQNILKRTLLA